MTGITAPMPDDPTKCGPDEIADYPDFAEVLRSLVEFTALDARTAPHRVFEAELAALGGGLPSWVLPAWCRVCDQGSLLHVDLQSSDGVTPNFWDRLVCPTCGLSCRQRFLAEQFSALAVLGGGGARTTRVEGDPGAFGPWVRAAAASHPGLRVEMAHGGGSDDAAGGPLLSIFCIDELTRVQDLDATLRSWAGALSAGGRLVLSVPFYAWARTTVSLPVDAPDEGGWRHQLGWDLLERCLAAGFSDAYVVSHWSAAFGYLGGGAPLAVVAEKA